LDIGKLPCIRVRLETPAQHRKSAIVYAAFTSSGAWHVPMFATGDK